MTLLPLAPDDADNAAWFAWRAEVDRRLNAARPSHSGPLDQDWQRPVIAWAYENLPDVDTLVKRAVREREGQANKRANAMLRRYAAGQGMLVWSDLGPLPFTVDGDGLRIRFDEATPNDLLHHADWVRRDARRRHRAELEVADALEDLARRADEAGLDRVCELGDLPARSEAP